MRVLTLLANQGTMRRRGLAIMLASTIGISPSLFPVLSFLPAAYAQNVEAIKSPGIAAEPSSELESFSLPRTIDLRNVTDDRPLTTRVRISLLDGDGQLIGNFAKNGMLFRLESSALISKNYEECSLRIELKTAQKTIVRTIIFAPQRVAPDNQSKSNGLWKLYFPTSKEHIDFDSVSRGEAFLRSGQTDRALAFFEPAYEQLSQSGRLDTDLAVRVRLGLARSLHESTSSLHYHYQNKASTVYSSLIQDFDKDKTIFAKLKLSRIELISERGANQNEGSEVSVQLKDTNTNEAPDAAFRRGALVAPFKLYAPIAPRDFISKKLQIMEHIDRSGLPKTERRGVWSFVRSEARSRGRWGAMVVLGQILGDDTDGNKFSLEPSERTVAPLSLPDETSNRMTPSPAGASGEAKH